MIDFLKQVFEAIEIERMNNPDNSIGHATVKIGDSVLMMSDARHEPPHKPMPSGFYLYMKNTDATYKRALQAGATSLMGTSRPILRRQKCRSEGSAWQLLVDRHS